MLSRGREMRGGEHTHNNEGFMFLAVPGFKVASRAEQGMVRQDYSRQG